MTSGQTNLPAPRKRLLPWVLAGVTLLFLAPLLSMLSTSVRNDYYTKKHPGDFLPRAEYVRRPNGEWREVLSSRVTFRDFPDSPVGTRIGNWSGTVDKWVGVSDGNRVVKMGPTPRNYFHGLIANRFGYTLMGAMLTWIVSASVLTVSSALVAWSFSVLRWPGRDLAFYGLLATLLVPTSLMVVPTYGFYHALGLQESDFVSTMLPSLCGNAFLVFLLRRHFLRIPRELLDAARIEGGSDWQILRRVVLPLSWPVLTVAAMLGFLWPWSEALNAMAYNGGMSGRPLSFGLNPGGARLTKIIELGFPDSWSSNFPAGMGELTAITLVMVLPVAAVLFLARKRLFLGVRALLPIRASVSYPFVMGIGSKW